MEIKSKPRIVIWFVSNDGRFIGNAINILTRQFNGVDIIGVTANQKISVNNLPFIPLNEISLNGGGYDILLVAGARQMGIAGVVKFAQTIKIDVNKILGDWIVCIPGFTLDKYRKLQRSQLSVFSQHCFGGVLNHTLGLPLLSPFVNLGFDAKEFIKFLHAPRIYMEEQFYFKEMRFEHNLKRDYPVVSLGNVDIHMNHDTDFNEAIAKWNKRKPRINWYNLFVVMYTGAEEFLEQFNELPYGKKVCFTSFKSDLDSAWYIDTRIDTGAGNDTSLAHIVNRFGSGHIFYYDVFDMLLYGKKTPLIEM